MPKHQQEFKRPSKKHQPRGLSILYEDQDILVVDKIHGLLTISTERVREETAYYRLNAYVRKGNSKSKNRIFIVHRLDRDTSGILVFAKNEQAKQYLQAEWQGFTKTYYAVVRGTFARKEGIITSYLTENAMHHVYSVADPQHGKLAKTGYKVLRESKMYSLLEIALLTGRKNQIRVHLSEFGCPVVGDKKYGVQAKEKGMKRLALHAAALTIVHPSTHETMTFETPVPAYFESLVQ
jgi:RluA family pseudouridine synthase